MNYRIQHNIAAHVSVFYGADEFACIYLSADKAPECYLNANMGTECWHVLPVHVQEAVRAMFSAVFALPLSERGAFIRQSAPVSLEAV